MTTQRSKMQPHTRHVLLALIVALVLLVVATVAARAGY